MNDDGIVNAEQERVQLSDIESLNRRIKRSDAKLKYN